MFDKMKDLLAMQRKMQEIKRSLEETNFDLQSPDGLVKITMNGAQEIKTVTLKEDLTDAEQSRLAGVLKDTVNRSIKRSQEIAAQKMREAAGGLNIPGLT